ncbi:hypothetical protein IFR05_000728 [Cadophora sp. M221]|nr:hypothetical protein IFR05_000728 [Cadophora sp. M221]
MSASNKPIGLLLRLNAKTFEPINALRAKYPAVRLPNHALFTGVKRLRTNVPSSLGFGFELATEEIEQLRKETYEEFSEAIRTQFPEQYLTKYRFVPKRKYTLVVRYPSEGLPEERTSEILAELLKQYPDGFGSIVVEGFALQEHAGLNTLRISEDRMKGEYPFGGN